LILPNYCYASGQQVVDVQVLGYRHQVSKTPSPSTPHFQPFNPSTFSTFQPLNKAYLTPY